MPDGNEARALSRELPTDLRPIPDPTVLTDQLVTKAIAALEQTVNARLDAIVHTQQTAEAVNVRHTDLAILSLREVIDAKLLSIAESNNYQREQVRVQVVDNLSQLRQLLEQRIAALTETVAVLKTTVNERFTQGDVQTEKAARDVKSAVDAAFAAAKEAVGEQNKSNALSIAKSEVATTKQIDQLSENLRISVKNTDDKIDGIKNNFDDKYTDLKDRVVAMEARGSVADPATGMAIRDMVAEIKALTGKSLASEGSKTGSSNTVGWIFGAVAALYGIIASIGVAVELASHH